MIKERTVFEASDGKQFATFDQADIHEFRQELAAAIEEGYWENELHTEESIDTLLARFQITRKPE